MRHSRIALALAASLLLLAGCSNGSEQVNVNVDGSTTVTTDEGTVTTGGMAVPSDWATDVPVYAGAQVMYTASVNPVDGKPGAAMVLTTSDKAQMVADYYKDALTTNGWTLEGTMMAGPMGTILGGSKDNRVVSMLISEADGVTTITMGVETHTD